MGQHMRHVSIALLFAGIGMAVQGNAAPKPAPAHHLRVTVTAEAVEVERATPGGPVLVIGYERIVRDFSPVYRRVQREATADARGSVAVPIGREVAPSSFWVAFDLESGGHGASGGTKLKLREGELPDSAFRNGSNGKKSKFFTAMDYVYVVAIRPRVAVWETTAGDGGESDDDGALNGTIEMGSGRFVKTRHAREEFAAFEQGDVVAMFVPHQMGYLVTRVKK